MKSSKKINFSSLSHRSYVGIYSLIIVLINLYTDSFGQNWFPVKATWHYSQIKTDINTGFLYNSYYKMEVVKDTVVLGKDCRIIERSNSCCDLLPARIFVSEESNVITLLNYNMTRWDTLINMNCNIGEFWVIHPNDLYSNDSIIISVVGKGYKVINNDTLDALKVEISNNDWTWTATDSIIEKIGFYPGYFLFQFWACDFQTGKLRCYEDDVLGLFETSESSFCEEEIGLSVDEFESIIRIYPNLTSSSTSIQFENDPNDFSIAIFNMEGQLIQQYEPYENPTQIDFSTFQKGIYLILIRNKSTNKLYHEKIIKA